MKAVIRYSIGMVLALLVTVSAYAQPPEDARRPDPERMRELMQKIIEHKHARLREVLNLEGDAARKFFEIYGPAEKEMGQLVAERNAMELKLLKLTQGDYTDADVDPTLAEIERLNEQIKERFMRLNEHLKPILTPRQRARLAVFEHEFNRKVRERIREHRRDKRHPDGPDKPPGDRGPRRPRDQRDFKRGPR